jgi:hypothetical protein
MAATCSASVIQSCGLVQPDTWTSVVVLAVHLLVSLYTEHGGTNHSTVSQHWIRLTHSPSRNDRCICAWDRIVVGCATTWNSAKCQLWRKCQRKFHAELTGTVVLYYSSHHTSDLVQVQPKKLFEGQQEGITMHVADGSGPCTISCSHRWCEGMNPSPQ